MRLNIPPKKQGRNTMHCGAACTFMVLRYLGDDVRYEEIIEGIRFYRRGSYAAELARFAIKRGYRAKLYLHQTDLFRKDMLDREDLTEEDLRGYQPYVKTFKRPMYQEIAIRKIISFIRAGGRFTTRLFNLKTIDTCLKRKVPPIICVGMRELTGNPKRSSGHYLLIKGKAGDHYIVNDPSVNAEDEYKIQEDHLLLAAYSWDGLMLVIER